MTYDHLGGGGRTGRGAYRGFKTAKRVFHQRSLLADIRYRAVVEALYPGRKRDDPIPSTISQAAKLLCDELDYVEIPEERSRGFMRGMRRRIQENVTHGIRFPEWRAGMHTTFFRRLTLWGQRVAESEKGGEALDLAGIPPDPQRAALFGRRFSVATYGLLIDSRGPSDDEETLRIEMANEILHGMSDDARVERYRLLQDAVNSLATGLLTMATSYLGFGQSIEDALALSGATFALAASVITVRHLGSPAMSEKAQEARRQARNWLFSLHAWMVGYVLWGRGAVQRGEYEGIDQLAYIVRCLATHDAEIPDLPRDPDIQEDLVLLIENSERAGDTELTAALMRLQGVLRWRSEHLGSAIGNLIAIVQNIPDFGEEISPPIMLTAGEPDRPELPPPRREATPDEEPRPGIPPSRTE